MEEKRETCNKQIFLERTKWPKILEKLQQGSGLMCFYSVLSRKIYEAQVSKSFTMYSSDLHNENKTIKSWGKLASFFATITLGPP